MILIDVKLPACPNQILHPKSKQHHSLYILFSKALKKSVVPDQTTNTLNWFDDYASNISIRFHSGQRRSMARVTICCALIGATIFLSVVATAADVRP
jgi:hypothetical protein